MRFLVKNKAINVHRVVIAASSQFFLNTFKENNGLVEYIIDDYSFETVGVAVMFTYNNEIDVGRCTLELVRFDMLLKFIEMKLNDKVNLDNFFECYLIEEEVSLMI